MTKDETQKTTGSGIAVIIPIVVALIGACATIVAAFREPITERFFRTPTPAPLPLTGVWEGTDAHGIVFRFTFAAKCEVGNACGKVELPGVGCTAIPVLVSSDGTTYEFDEIGHQNCGPDTGNDFIKVLEDGTLLFGGSGQTPDVVLYRK